MPYCNNCGKKIAEGAEFCHSCGKKIDIKTATPESRSVSKRRYKPNQALNIGIIVLAVFIVLYFAIPKSTSADVYCGDGICQSSESCSTCSHDCGQCASQNTQPATNFCGDGKCSSSESCSTCSSDCGQCSAYCGDGTCQSSESCSTCSQDCGSCEIVVIQPTKQYGPNQIAGCEEGGISLNGIKADRDACYHFYAIRKNNYFYCEEISDISKKDKCYLIIGRDQKNTYICSLISATSNCEGEAQGASGMLNCRDTCYHDIAINTLTSSICEDVGTQNGKDACYWGVALASKNSNLCSKIVTSSGTISNEYCYYLIAVQANNINICSPINEAEHHDQCIMVIIRNLKLKDLTLCNQMTTDWKSSCQHEIETGNYVS